MIDSRVLGETNVSGLFWGKNYCVATGPDSYTLVSNQGPLINDFLYFGEDSFNNFSLHLGQLNRFTFFGDPSQEITCNFVDCRKDSETLHTTTELSFYPDPKQALHIDRGIATRMSRLKNIAIRSEPVWYATTKDNGYNVGNDEIIVPSDTTPLDQFPIVEVNDLPLPNDVLRIILNREQEILKNDTPYDTTVDVVVDGHICRIDLRN